MCASGVYLSVYYSLQCPLEGSPCFFFGQRAPLFVCGAFWRAHKCAFPVRDCVDIFAFSIYYAIDILLLRTYVFGFPVSM